MKTIIPVGSLAGLVVAAAAICCAQQLHSATSQPQLQPKRVIQDHYADTIPVASTNIIKGAILGAAGSRVLLDQLNTYIPDGHGQGICLHLASRDGRYNGEFEYEIRSLSSGRYNLIIASQWKSQLARYRADELAVLVVFKDCSPLLPGDTLSVASWGDWSESNRITLFLNAVRLDSRVFIPDGGQLYDCTEIDSPIKTAFDTQCGIIFPTKKTTQFAVRLYRFESPQPEVLFRIAIP